ncbi:MAG: PTS sugar transporter subunit IIA, partial [Candidatus Hydrogenedentota bacterium]
DILDYESLDEQPIRIVCMLAARNDQHAQYLKMLGIVSSVLKNKEVREALMAAPDDKSAYLILTQ